MDKNFFSNLSRSAQEQYLIQEEILLGKYGPPGSPFLTTNALADTRNISVVTAHNILTGLRDAGFIELKGKKYYLSHSKLTENFLNQTQIISLLIPTLNNEFYSSLSNAVIQMAGQQGYRVLVMSTSYSAVEERKAYELMRHLSVSGIISCLTTSQENLQMYKDHDLPCVFLTQSINGLKKSSVQVNNFSISQKVAKHLIEQGYKKFFYIGTPNTPLSNDVRYTAFQMGLNQEGFALDEKCVFQISQNDKTNMKHLSHAFEKEKDPVGVFCYHDLIAAQLYRICYKLGKQIPKDIGIVGFDNLSITTALYPPLTSVHYRVQTMADIAVKQLIANIKDPNSVYDNYYIEPTLIERNSSNLSAYQ